MPNRTSKTGSELFIVDNSDSDWKVRRYLHDWCDYSKSLDVATAYFEIGSLLALDGEWQKVDEIRILMGDEVSLRTKAAFEAGLANISRRLDGSLEQEKEKNDFLAGVPAVVDALRNGKIRCRVYRKAKFHAKAYITHARKEVLGSAALVGSSNFTFPGLTENIELNVQITGGPVTVLQEWYDEHWNDAEDVTPEILRVIDRHVRDFTPFEVYAKALHELHRRQPPSEEQWLANYSRVYSILDQYQKDGFHQLLDIAERYDGAFLCDGVGLGKTFVGLMLLEYLIEHKRKRVALFVPKAARKAVWERSLRDYAPHLSRAYTSLRIFNHTDLTRIGNDEIDYPRLLEDVREQADVVLIDEAHHFRNLGYAGTGRGLLQAGETSRRPSRYHQLYQLIEGPRGVKEVFLLTATPVNNRLLDVQHMIELFSRRVPDRFKELGIHSLPGHVRIGDRYARLHFPHKCTDPAGRCVQLLGGGWPRKRVHATPTGRGFLPMPAARSSSSDSRNISRRRPTILYASFFSRIRSYKTVLDNPVNPIAFSTPTVPLFTRVAVVIVASSSCKFVDIHVH